MSCNLALTFFDGFNIDEIVWARRHYDGIYWPGRITFIATNSTDESPTNNNLRFQSWSYLIQFFGYNETNYTRDVLPYRQYRDYMSQYLLIYYDSYPQIKYHFLNAINQADYVDINENPNSIKTDNSNSSYSFNTNPNGNHIPTSNSILTACRNPISHTTHDYSQSSNIYYQHASNYPSNTQLSLNNYCYGCTQPPFPPTNQLSIETNLNNEYVQLQSNVPNSQIEASQTVDSVMIITTKTYSNSSFISYLFNSLSNFFPSSIIYLDHLTNHQHPTTSNIYYLICLDHFDSTIKQTLDSTILNNLNPHTNHFFLVMNTPSHEFVRHIYSTVMDKRSILVLHYHSTFDNDPILLCSGNRTTFEMIRSSFLKYLCSKMKYIESNDDEEQRLHTVDGISLAPELNNIKNEPIIEISNQTSESNSFINYQNNTENCLSMMKHKKNFGRRKILNNLGKKILKRKFKHRLSKHQITSVTSSEYYVQNILDSVNSSK